MRFRDLARSVIGESTVANNYKTVNNTVVFNQGVGVERIAAATRSPIRPVSLRSAEPTVTRPARRELLDGDGRTLAVIHPPTAAPTVTSPAQPISSLSHLQPRTGRSANTTPVIPHSPGRSTPGVAPVQPTTTVSTTPGTAPAASDASRSTKSIIMRGNGRTATQAAQSANGPTDIRAQTAAAETAKSAVTHRPLPAGGRVASPPSERPRQAGAVNPGQAPAVAPRAAVPVVRSEPARVVVAQPTVQRASVVSVPAPSAAASAPVARMSSGPTVSAPPASRVETYRASASSPAPISGGGSRSSRSSSDGTGQRGSR